MRTRSQSRNNFPQQEASPAIVEPLRIELPFQEDQFREDTPEDPPEVPMADNRTMVKLLQAPTEGYEDAIIILEIAANNFELKHGNGNGGNNGCSYKTFTACNPNEINGKGGAVALTRWIEKMESMFDNSGCTTNQRVRFHELAKVVPHLVTPESSCIKRYICYMDQNYLFGGSWLNKEQ
nr:reverse transcriptase domain-containing protein [Tanacetum cinerariifolium]